MDWNKAVFTAGQCVVVIVLGACVIAGHNSVITDALMAISGSLAGVGVYQVLGKRKAGDAAAE